MSSVAKLYYGKTSFWSAVVRMTIVEKGYGEDEIEFKLIDMVAGDNYKPEYLLINPFGTVPALVVPLEKSLAPDMEVKYKALTDSKPIVEFLDKSRSALSHTHTTSAAPAPVLTPATISHLNISSRLIDTIRGEPSVAAFVWSAKAESDLLAKAKSPLGTTVQSRYTKLQQILSDDETYVPKKVLPTLQERFTRLGAAAKAFEAVQIEASARTPEQQAAIDAHLAKYPELWEQGLPKILAVFEQEIVGPLALGDQVSLADMYLAVWLTRITKLSGGDGTPEGVDKIPGVGPKVKAYWAAIIERPSWKAVFGSGIF
ncbi:hypothetical protein EXIGLDRAFT_760237 [Exidia glandulosa HHB12029]|uniref:GST N-terminal domain-containing protein n=1 Tax=Exidia glandulosa HHB12029 TaxID=1314781 RepID=A0A165PDC5_EXIGL|nr:hypothetical protein EXIGLDRAFT_760237 [Exidia glandulosa HHB12029]